MGIGIRMQPKIKLSRQNFISTVQSILKIERILAYLYLMLILIV